MAKHILEERRSGLHHPIGTPVGKVLKGYNDILANENVSEVISGPLNKLWRAKILLDRITKPISRVTTVQPTKSVDPKRNSVKYGQQFKSIEGSDKNDFVAAKKSRSTVVNIVNRNTARLNRITHQGMWVLGDSDPLVTSWSQDTERNTKRSILAEKLRKDNSIQIINFSSNPLQYIELQTIPTEVQHTSENTWAVINSMGRNLPMYHYTGSETSLTFNISWYSDDRNNPDDVITKCRLLEAWSKADGYVKAPPILQIRWGSADVFKDQFFILVKADYKLSNWRVSARKYDKNTKKFVEVGKQPGLQPSVATQELLFKRVSLTNLRHSEIVSTEMLKLTKGIKYE